MMNRKLLTIIVGVLFSFNILFIQCGMSISGGGTEDVNTMTIAGIIQNADQKPAGNTQVKLIPHNYDPYDSEISNEFIDTTNSVGLYSFTTSDTGLYNIEAVHILNRTRLFLRNVAVSDDSTVTEISTLGNAGRLKLLLPDSDTINTATGYIYIEGTSYKTGLSGASLNNDGYYTVYFDSVPSGVSPSILYNTETSSEDPLLLIDSVEIIPNDSTVNEAFISWNQYTTSNSGLKGNQISDIFIEPNGAVWVSTFGKGVASFDGNEWILFNTGNSGLPSDSVYEISIDQNGGILFATTNGAAIYNKSGWTVYNSSNSGLHSDNITNFEQDNNGNYWFGTFNSDAAKFDGSNWTKVILYEPSVNYFMYDSSHNDILWFATEKGFTSLEEFSSTYVSVDTSNYLPNNSAYYVAFDNVGDRWLTYSGGVTNCSGEIWTSYIYTHYNSNESEVLGANDIKVFVDKDNNKWFGSSKGLTKFDGSNWVDHKGEKYKLLKDKKITAISVDGDGKKWIGTAAYGVIVFGPSGSK